MLTPSSPKYAVLGDRVVVHPFACGRRPAVLEILTGHAQRPAGGAGTVLREYVTVNRSIHAGQETVVGENWFFFHVGRPRGPRCAVGSNVGARQQRAAAGHVSVGDFSFIGGGAAVHQFTRIGEGVMVGGFPITATLAPFTSWPSVTKYRVSTIVGLKRRGFSAT